jgi:DNA-binding transcriptional LysR family regulator
MKMNLDPQMMMNLRHIEVFHAVYQTGSVSGAARALHVSQPSVSKVLRHAESRIGFLLFRVVKGRLVPTDEAHILFHEARELHGRVESLRETTKNLRRGGEGHLRLAVLPSLGLDIAPAAVAQFRISHPDVSFEIKTLHNEDILRSLYERNSDLAVAYDAPRHPRLADVHIGSGELVLLYRKEDLEDAPPRVSLDMFKHRDLIRLAGSGSVGNLFSSEVDPDEPGRPSISVQTYYVAAALVRRGAGCAVVDEFTARAYLSEDLDYRPLAQHAAFNVYCVHLEDRPLSRIAREFVAVLKQIVEKVRP